MYCVYVYSISALTMNDVDYILHNSFESQPFWRDIIPDPIFGAYLSRVDLSVQKLLTACQRGRIILPPVWVILSASFWDDYQRKKAWQ